MAGIPDNAAGEAIGAYVAYRLVLAELEGRWASDEVAFGSAECHDIARDLHQRAVELAAQARDWEGRAGKTAALEATTVGRRFYEEDYKDLCEILGDAPEGLQWHRRSDTKAPGKTSSGGLTGRRDDWERATMRVLRKVDPQVLARLEALGDPRTFESRSAEEEAWKRAGPDFDVLYRLLTYTEDFPTHASSARRNKQTRSQ